MLVEIHMLQNHVPSNLNRDDTGESRRRRLWRGEAFPEFVVRL